MMKGQHEIFPCRHDGLGVLALMDEEGMGEEGAEFLNDLLTAQIHGLAVGVARLACLLSPQGRILFDMMVIKESDKIYLITEKTQLQGLVQKLKLYRLRRKIQIEILDDLVPCHVGGHVAEEPAPHAICVARDERHESLGWLCLLKPDAAGAAALGGDEAWHALRIRLTIAQGGDDLTPNRALMLEAGLQHLGGVDFEKGCYIGQEVTARTHYRGLVKRQMIAVTSATMLEAGMEIFLGTKHVGTCGSVARDASQNTSENQHEPWLSLASMRCEAIAQIKAGEGQLCDASKNPIDLYEENFEKNSRP